MRYWLGNNKWFHFFYITLCFMQWTYNSKLLIQVHALYKKYTNNHSIPKLHSHSICRGLLLSRGQSAARARSQAAWVTYTLNAFSRDIASYTVANNFFYFNRLQNLSPVYSELNHPAKILHSVYKQVIGIIHMTLLLSILIEIILLSSISDRICTLNVSVPACSSSATGCKTIGGSNMLIKNFISQHPEVYADECQDTSGAWCFFTDVKYHSTCSTADTSKSK